MSTSTARTGGWDATKDKELDVNFNVLVLVIDSFSYRSVYGSGSYTPQGLISTICVSV